MEALSEGGQSESRGEPSLICILCCITFQPGDINLANENEQLVNDSNADNEVGGNNYGEDGGGGHDNQVKTFSKFCDEVVTTVGSTSLPTQQLAVIKDLVRFNSKLNDGHVDEGGGVSVCSPCLKTVGVTMEMKEKMDTLECHVRSLQLEILRELRELEGILEEYNSGMGRIKEVVRRSDGESLQFPMKEGPTTAMKMEMELESGISLFRECILGGTSGRTPNFTNNISLPDIHPKIEEVEVKLEMDENLDDGGVPDLDFDYFPDNFNDDNDSEEDVKNVIVQPRKSVRARKPVDAFIPHDFRTPVPPIIPQSMLELGSENLRKKTATSKKSNEGSSKSVSKASTTGTSKKESGRKKTYIFNPDNPPIAPPPRPGKCIRKFIRSRNGKRVKAAICCEICKFTTKKEPAFEQHLRDHETDDKPFQCTLCPSKFSTSAYLNFHVMGHQGHYKMCCDVCLKWVPFPELLYHIKSHVPPEDQVDAPEIIFCQNCSFCCTTHQAYTKHLGKHSSRKCLKEGKFKCHKCEEEYGTFGELNKHLDEEHGKLERFTCEWENCGKSFLSRNGLSSHHRYTHSDVERKVKCEECGKNCTDIYALNTHILKFHTKDSDKPFACKVCSKEEARFATKIELHKHEMREHGAPKFKCKICGQEFTCKSYLKMHTLALHGNKGLTCEKCGKVCLNVPLLKNHMISHSEERNWTCEECGKSFKRSKGLKLHMMVHRGEKNWKCGYCDKSFTRKEYLVLHERIHTGERPYVCDSCGKAFSQKTSLRIHEKTQHKNKELERNAGDQDDGPTVTTPSSELVFPSSSGLK